LPISGRIDGASRSRAHARIDGDLRSQSDRATMTSADILVTASASARALRAAVRPSLGSGALARPHRHEIVRVASAAPGVYAA
jgi:hypothetical protein